MAEMRTAALTWQVVTPANSGPGPRSRHGLVYDRRAKAAVLFGGIVWASDRLKSDTWELRLRKWTQIDTGEAPLPRHRGAMVYLDNMEVSLLFGGQSGGGTFLDDTWTYAHQRWRRVSDRRWWGLSRRASPSPRCGHSLAYHEGEGVAVLFGGVNPDHQPLGDTWLFDGIAWWKLEVPGPPSRRYAAFAYDPGLKGCVLHGGAEDDNGQRKFREAWLFQDNSWTPLGIKYRTDPRDDHGLAYHQGIKRLVMLEGLGDERGILTGEATGWEPLQVKPLHPRHQCSPLAWNEELGGLLLHGGEAGHGGPQFDATLLLRVLGTAPESVRERR